MKTASWVISDRTTGRAVFETFDKRTAGQVRRDHSARYAVTPIYDWLVGLNQCTQAARAMRGE